MTVLVRHLRIAYGFAAQSEKQRKRAQNQTSYAEVHPVLQELKKQEKYYYDMNTKIITAF